MSFRVPRFPGLAACLTLTSLFIRTPLHSATTLKHRLRLHRRERTPMRTPLLHNAESGLVPTRSTRIKHQKARCFIEIRISHLSGVCSLQSVPSAGGLWGKHADPEIRTSLLHDFLPREPLGAASIPRRLAPPPETKADGACGDIFGGQSWQILPQTGGFGALRQGRMAHSVWARTPVGGPTKPVQLGALTTGPV
jgi:hypothetical protein